MNKEKLMLVSLAVVVLGLAGFGYGLWACQKEAEVLNWPSVQGTIVTSRVEHSGPVGSKHRRTFALIEYEYKVGGKDFSSNIVNASDIGSQQGSSGVRTSDSLGAVETVRSYPRGNRVTVHYNPANPSEAVLEVQKPLWVELALWGGLPLALIGVLAFFWLRKNMSFDPAGKPGA